MAESATSGGGPPWNLIFGILAALGAAAHFVPPLTTSRPEVTVGTSSSVYGDQTIDARLWQDPLEVQSLDAKRLKAAPPAVASQTITYLTNQIREQKLAPKVIAVMISGLPYAEEEESRLRTRLAVVSGLGRSRYVPEDGEHLGVVRFDFPDSRSSNRPLVIPYEWWHRQTWRSDAAGVRDTSRLVLVIWLREDSFADRPLSRLARVLKPVVSAIRAKCDAATPPDVTVIGPVESITLRRMLIEADAGGTPDGDTLGAIEMLTPTATASDDQLRYPLSDGSRGDERGAPADANVHVRRDAVELANLLQAGGGLKRFHRMIATDYVLARSLVEELRLRRINASISGDNSKQHIAIISEWDTLYGRSLPLAFASAVMDGTIPEYAFVDSPAKWPDWVHRFSYLRGIDGRLPGDRGSTPATVHPQELPTLSDSASISSALIAPPPAEVTEGKDQSDALRRLSDNLFQLNESLRPAGGLRAVGVLGSDVYDKLEILKALKPGLPNATFFTTHLDARYALPEELKETQNLLVASPFGLQLTEADLGGSPFGNGLINPWSGLQGDIPPFRDSYQTATFLTTLYALGQPHIYDNDLDMSLSATRMYEIGRHGPVDFSHEHKGEEIHPRLMNSLLLSMRGWNCWLILVALAIPYFFLAARNNLSPLRPWTWFRGAGTAILIFLLALLVFALVVVGGSGRDGEPMDLLDGVSIWGAEMLRFVAITLAVIFITLSAVRLRKLSDALGNKYHLGSVGGATRAGSWHRRFRMRLLRGWKECARWKQPEERPKVVAKDLWQRYRLDSILVRRLVRVSIYVIATLIAVSLLWYGFAEAPDVPARGEWAFRAHTVIALINFLLMLALLFFVADAGRTCRRLTVRLGCGTTTWPHAVLHKNATRYDLPHPIISALLDVRLVADITQEIMPMVYYPFVIILILAAARSPFFAPWHWPTFVVVIFILMLLVMVNEYVRLRLAAETIRDDTIKVLKEALNKLPPQHSDRERIIASIEEVRDLRTGAFESAWRTHVVGAVLLPFAGVGAWALLHLLIG